MFLLKEAIEKRAFTNPELKLITATLQKPGNHFITNLKADNKEVVLRNWEGGRYGLSVWTWKGEGTFKGQSYISKDYVDLTGGSCPIKLVATECNFQDYDPKQNVTPLSWSLKRQRFFSGFAYLSGEITLLVDGNLYAAEPKKVDTNALLTFVKNYSRDSFKVPPLLKSGFIQSLQISQTGDTLECSVGFETGKGYSSHFWQHDYKFTWSLGFYDEQEKIYGTDPVGKALTTLRFAIGDGCKAQRSIPTNLVIHAYRDLD